MVFSSHVFGINLQMQWIFVTVAHSLQVLLIRNVTLIDSVFISNVEGISNGGICLSLKTVHTPRKLRNVKGKVGKSRLLAVWLYKHKHSLKWGIYKNLNCSYMILREVVG